MNEPETIRNILEKAKTIAVVGLSDKPERPAFHVSRYMQREGYRIIPVHPNVSQALGEKAYPTLDAAYASEGKIDLVVAQKAHWQVIDALDEGEGKRAGKLLRDHIASFRT